jgi:hypothetical protein
MMMRVAVLAAFAGTAMSRSPAVETARDVIRQHVQAMGGEAAVARLTSRTIWATYTITGSGERGALQVFTARPNKRAIKVSPADVGSETIVFDGERGWTVTAGSAPKAVGKNVLAELRDESTFDFELHPDSLFRSIELIGESNFDGRRCRTLRVVSVTQREWFEYYDVQTGLLAGRSGHHETNKEAVTLKMIFSDYATFDGVKLPRKIVFRMGGVEQVIRVMTVKHNGVSDAVFAPPAGLR